MVLIDSRPAREVAGPLPASVSTPERMLTPRVPLLFLVADTGGGHRSAARAVGEALEEAYPGRFDAVLCDPLGGPGSSRLLRWVTSLYGPVIRLAPWAWGAVYHASDSRRVMRLLQRTLLTLADRPVADAVAAHKPAAIVSFHPLTGGAADRVSRRQSPSIPVMTVVTDLVTSHAAWQLGRADRMAVPSAAVRRRCHLDGLAANCCLETGLPVASGFCSGPLPDGARAALRRSLGVSERRFLAVLTGGGEGSGGMARRVAAILGSSDEIDVVAICGRNLRLQRRLAGRASRARGRLKVLGFVDNMSDWLRCADVVIAKAGPGTIAEATCCGAPLLLTSHLPGQEKGNARFVTAARAGRHAPRRRQMLRELGELRRNPVALGAMRAASSGLGRPGAAGEVAALLASLADSRAGLAGMKAGRHG
ncbi:MAG TPA: glycosyltransferase [Streptosporangiaceae bacterium]|jgi:1,2-diacylglycerol 3-beta-galactosyltransferase